MAELNEITEQISEDSAETLSNLTYKKPSFDFESSVEKKELPLDFDNLRNKATDDYELQCRALKINLQQLESDKQQLINRIDNLSADKQELMNRIDNLSQVNKSYWEQIGLLQQASEEMRIQVDKLHSDSSVAIRERNMGLEDLQTQKIVATDVKKHLEQQVERLLNANQHLSKRMDRRVEELLTDKKAMTSCIETLNEQLKEKEWKAQLACRARDQLKRENKKMEQRIGRLVQWNVQLQHQVKSSAEKIERLEQQNIDLYEQVNELEWEEEPEPIPQSSIAEPAGQTAKSSTQASTPPARVENFDEEVKWAYLVPPKSSVAKNKSYDALEEYLHLSAEAVKISFPMIDVSIDELLRKANKLPFYRVHDVLNRYMMEKLQWQEAQERKKLLESKDVSVNQSRSVLTKVRGLFARSRNDPAERIRSLSCDTGFHHVVQFAPNQVPEPDSDGEWHRNSAIRSDDGNRSSAIRLSHRLPNSD